MTPSQYLEAFVDPNRLDCHDSPGDIRMAFNAAVSASHLADHYFTYNKRHNPDLVESFHKLGDFVDYLSTQTNGCFKDIRSISNAYKHLYTNVEGPHSTYASVSSSGSIDVIKLDNSFIDELEEESTDCDAGAAAPLQVVFKRKDGSRARFLPVLDTVVDYFEELIFARTSQTP